MMDNLLETFTESCKISKEDHPHYALYKQKASKVSQSERRAAYLKAQKQKRYDYLSHVRQLAATEQETYSGDETMENYHEETEDDDEMNIDLVPKKYPRKYKDQLMMSEWMVEVPEDLADNWLLKFCPAGKRCLIVASKGITKAYSRKGYCINVFPSSLPGGNRKDSRDMKAATFTLLDCVYSSDEKTYYIIDMICWNEHPLYESETDFRFYWVDSKLRECCPKALEISSSNQYKFHPLPFYTCDEQSLRSAIQSPLPFNAKLDGLLFFHKYAHYIPKVTPLVCWLKGFMVPEMLNIPVTEEFLNDVPPSYTTMRNYIPETFVEYEKQKEKQANEMET